MAAKRVLRKGPAERAHTQAPEAGPEAPLVLPRFEGASRLLIFPLCLWQPAAGLVLAALYMSQGPGTARRFGWVCLGLALIGAAARGSHGGGYGESLTQPFY